MHTSAKKIKSKNEERIQTTHKADIHVICDYGELYGETKMKEQPADYAITHAG
jgi:hypothetical protein